MHFIELSKIDLEQSDNALARWMRFLFARNEEELEEVLPSKLLANSSVSKSTPLAEVSSQT
jgi:hypothetical protein